MNTKYILFNLREAREELDSTIKEIETDNEYGEAKLSVAMMHLYHHLNTAWNARNTSDEDANSCSDEDFNQWSGYPSDLRIMSLE